MYQQLEGLQVEYALLEAKHNTVHEVCFTLSYMCIYWYAYTHKHTPQQYKRGV